MLSAAIRSISVISGKIFILIIRAFFALIRVIRGFFCFFPYNHPL